MSKYPHPEVSLEIRLLQRALNEIVKTHLDLTGVFDERTKRALGRYQSQQKFMEYDKAGTSYGSESRARLGVYIEERFITERTVQAAADMLEVKLSNLKTAIGIFSHGDGFDPSGLIRLSFNRYRFYNELVSKLGKSAADELQQTNPDLILLGGHSKPPSLFEVHAFNQAAKLEEVSASKSCIVGMFQVSSAEYLQHGYKTPQEMLSSYNVSEVEQLMSFCRFLKNRQSLLDALRKSDWTTFYHRAGDLNVRKVSPAGIGNLWLTHLSGG
jgi:hypothetical protein